MIEVNINTDCTLKAVLSPRILMYLDINRSCTFLDFLGFRTRWVVLGVVSRTFERDDDSGHSNQHGDGKALAHLLIS